jgi:hypothetical protein
LIDLKNSYQAREFVVNCLEGEDKVLSGKAHVTISMWAYTGLPELRENNLIENLKPENKGNPTYDASIQQLKRVLNIKTNTI